MMSAYEHGRNAAQHGKHIQACPFDTGASEWRVWRQGFCDESAASSRGLLSSWSPYQGSTCSMTLESQLS
jgi:hypothetical protein